MNINIEHCICVLLICSHNVDKTMKNMALKDNVFMTAMNIKSKNMTLDDQ